MQPTLTWMDFGIGWVIIAISCIFTIFFKIKVKGDLNILEGFGVFSFAFDVLIALYTLQKMS